MPRLVAGALYRALPKPPQFRKLREVDGHAPRLVLGQPLVHGATVRLLVEIEIAQGLPVGAMENETLLELLTVQGGGKRR